MLPWGHAAVGYLCHSLWSRFATGGPPTDRAVWLLLFATQLPDLVDKPLGWSLAVLPSGRSLAHSAFTAAAVVAVAVHLGRRYDTVELPVAFSIGYVTHIVTDAIPLLARGETEYLVFLLWPLIETPYDPAGKTIFGELPSLAAGGFFDPRDVVVLLALVALWAVDGFPGLPLKRSLKRSVDRRRGG